MALIGSLDSGVNAMQSFVKGMEVIGDNIANSKTVGFKRQRINYTDNFSNTLRDATPGTRNSSNLPPIQVGAGVSITAAQKLFGQGSIELTGVASDLAISGEGFFRVYDAASEQQFLTRDGSFRVDENGYLADKNGNFLLGLVGGDDENAPNVVGRMQISLAEEVKMDGQGRPIDSSGRLVLSDGTRVLDFSGTEYRVDSEGRVLDGDAPFIGAQAIILDDVGSPAVSARAVLHDDDNYYLISDAGAYIQADGTAITPAATLAALAIGDPAPTPPTGAVEWNTVSQPFSSPDPTATPDPSADGVWDDTVHTVAQPDPDDPNQFALAVQNWTINKDGELRLTLNDGTSYVRGQVMLQQVQDQDALTEEGSGLYSGLVNAGPVGMLSWNIGSSITNDARTAHVPNQSGVGFIQSRALEGSNTDLTQEFADMITTQRAFQAGSKVISVSDEMLQEIINLKR